MRNNLWVTKMKCSLSSRHNMTHVIIWPYMTLCDIILFHITFFLSILHVLLVNNSILLTNLVSSSFLQVLLVKMQFYMFSLSITKFNMFFLSIGRLYVFTQPTYSCQYSHSYIKYLTFLSNFIILTIFLSISN